MITQDFASVWPDVADRLASMLRRRGINTHDADEVVQETAARAFGGAVPFTDADDLFRWASVVSWRISIDMRRRRLRLSDDEVPERADPVDVAVAAESRIVLGAVQQRMAEMSAHDQALLLSSFHDAPESSRRESVRLAVALHRARKRLRILLDGLAAPVVGLWARHWRRWVAPIEAIGYAAVPTAACLVIGIAALAVPTPTVDQVPQASEESEAIPISANSTSARELVSSAGAMHDTPPGGPPRAAPPKGVVPPIGVTIVKPDGQPAQADVRPKGETDHLACLTPPPVTGQTVMCVEQPVMLRISPP